MLPCHWQETNSSQRSGEPTVPTHQQLSKVRHRCPAQPSNTWWKYTFARWPDQRLRDLKRQNTASQKQELGMHLPVHLARVFDCRGNGELAISRQTRYRKGAPKDLL